MFRHVPECCGMFRLPGFIDGLQKSRRLTQSSMVRGGCVLHQTSFEVFREIKINNNEN